MSIAAIKAGKAFYEILAEDKTAKGLGSAEARLRKFGTTVGAIGASLTGLAAAGMSAIGAMVKSFAGAGDNISDAMAQTGMGSDFLQSLKFGAADAGVAFDALLAGVGKFQSLITDAAGGSESANATLAKLGVTIGDLAGLSPDQQFSKMADAIARIKDPAARAAAAIDVFGKSGAKLLPMFAEGAEGLAKAMEDLKARKMIMSPEDVKLAQQAEGAFLSLGLGFSRVVELIGAAVAPAFLKVADVIQTVIDSVVLFLDQNRELVKWVTIGIGVLGAIGIALMAVGGAAMMAGTALSGIAAIGATIGAVFAFIASPIFIIGAAIVACGVAALTAAYYLDQLFNGGAALQYLKDMATGAMTAMQMLWTAISNGRWDLAGRLITDGLNVAFIGGLGALRGAWHDFTVWLVSSMVQAMTGAVQAVTGGIASMLTALQGAATMLGVTLPGVAGALNAVNGVGAGVTAGGNAIIGGMKAGRDASAARDAQRALDATSALAQTMGEIAASDSAAALQAKAAAQGIDPAKWFGSVSGQMLQSSRVAQSAGFASSIGAGRIGFAAPANQAEEQANVILDLIRRGIEKQTDVIESKEGFVFQ